MPVFPCSTISFRGASLHADAAQARVVLALPMRGIYRLAGMRIIETPELGHFREECRSWLADNVPRDPRPHDGEEMRDFDLGWQALQHKGGWAGVSWPKEYGGCGLSVLEQMIWHEEYARAGGPPAGTMFVALSHAGPTLIVQGTDEHKAEPGAGSDLASLKCKAEVDGDELVVNGTKIWTSYGHLARWQELLVRTGGDELPRHKGLTWAICDMTAPGIEVRPIRAMSGYYQFSQVFYDNVRIPLSNVLGGINEGWCVAMTTLGFERGTGTIVHQIELANTVEQLIAWARDNSTRVDEVQMASLAQLKLEVMALRSLTAASVSRGMHEEVPGAEGNIVALYYGELTRRVNAAAFDIVGAEALARSGQHDFPLHYLESFKWAIGGGTSEVRRNAIGERVLGLPRGPRAV
jgi:alkylation response protein AidB-like acyl-CoA dehydrogenase